MLQFSHDVCPIQRHAVVQINCVGLDIYVQERYGLYTMLWYCYFFSYLSLAFHYLCNNNGFQVMHVRRRSMTFFGPQQWPRSPSLFFNLYKLHALHFTYRTTKLASCMAMDGDESNQCTFYELEPCNTTFF